MTELSSSLPGSRGVERWVGWEGMKPNPGWFLQQPARILGYPGSFQSHLIRRTPRKFHGALEDKFLGHGTFVFWGMLISKESMALTTLRGTLMRRLDYQHGHDVTAFRTGHRLGWVESVYTFFCSSKIIRRYHHGELGEGYAGSNFPACG